MLNIKEGKGPWADWPIHVLCLIMTIIAEAIGNKKVNLGVVSFTMYPMLYCVIMGVVMGLINLLPMWMMKQASPYINISILMLSGRSMATLGPNIGLILSSGAALLLQYIGKIGSVLAVVLGVLVFKMGRAAVGMGFSIGRENTLQIVGSIWGLDSDEGIGAMGQYITGTILGTIVCGITSSLVASFGIFSPYALAMGSGMGSASMFNACIASVMDAYPDKADELYALGYASNSIPIGMYWMMFVALPFDRWLYNTLWKARGGEPEGYAHDDPQLN